MLVDGWVKIVGVTSDGHELTLALRGRGDTVGEMAGETTGYRNATVQAIGTVRALIVANEKFTRSWTLMLGADAPTDGWSRAGGTTRIDAAHPRGDQRSAPARRLLLDLAARRGSEPGRR